MSETKPFTNLEAIHDHAEDEWEHVAEIIPKFASASPNLDRDGTKEIPNIKSEDSSALVFTRDFLNHFRISKSDYTEIDLDSELQPTSNENMKMKIVRFVNSCFNRRRNLGHETESQLKLMIAISKSQFDDQDPIHFRILQTIYKQFTGNTKVDCPRFGSHWETIGFQGNDPATDLRGVGMLGLLGPLFLATTPEYVLLARNVLLISRSETQNFPFMVLSINLTRTVFVAFKDGLLNRMLTEQDNQNVGDDDNFWSLFNRFYAATLYRFYVIWKTEHKTIKDSGYVLLDVEKYVRKDPALTLKELESYLETFQMSDIETERLNLQR